MYTVTVSRRAESQLKAIYRYIAKESSSRIAERHVESIKAHIATLATLPVRGTERPAIAKGLRTMGFKRSVTIAFRVTEDEAVVVAVFYRGMNVQSRLGKPDRFQ